MINSFTNLLDFDMPALQAYCAAIGEKPFRAQQLQRWIHQFNASEFDSMTDLAKSFREKLKKQACISMPEVISDHTSKDGTRKWLIDAGKGNAVETVFIPEVNRGTLCISSQAGCAVNCQFCSTGKQGFSHNLTTSQIIGQLRLAEFILRESSFAHTNLKSAPQSIRVITNVVMMGMGEPLLNYHSVVPALRIMLDDYAYGLSRRRVTVSTSGVVPMMDRLSEELPVALAVSLHAPCDTLRDILVPLNKKYPLRELIKACERYLKNAPRDFITFEYCLLHEVNDSEQDAKALLALTRDLPCKFNLIPFNPFPKSGLKRSSNERVRRFADQLLQSGMVATIRKTRGDDIDAACGQLAGNVQDRTRLTQRTQEKKVVFLNR